MELRTQPDMLPRGPRRKFMVARAGERFELDEVSFQVGRPHVTVFLESRTRGITPERLGLLWHAAQVPPHCPLSISSASKTATRYRFRIESNDPDFNRAWVKWSFVRRHASALQGGKSVDELDQVDEDNAHVTVYVQPDETRFLGLDFEARLDTGSRPCDVAFWLVCEQLDSKDSPVEGQSKHVPCRLTLLHPRSVLLNSLPGMYVEAMDDLQDSSEDVEPPFFERYLVGFDDVIEPIKKTLDQLHTLFGPFTAPSDFMVWLAAWVCMPLDETWPDMKRRRLVAEAVELFRWRGTKRGLSRFLEIYCGSKPEIDDQPSHGMALGEGAVLGSETTVLGGVLPHTFIVNLVVNDDRTIDDRTVRSIIDSEKPAHTTYELNMVCSPTGKDRSRKHAAARPAAD